MSLLTEIAAEIDRPVWAVSGAVRDQHRDLPVASTLELGTFAPLINLLAFRDHMTEELIVRRYIYRGEAGMAGFMQNIVDADLFTREGSRLLPTDKLTGLANEVNDAVDRVCDQLWSGHEELTSPVSEMARSVLDAADDRHGMVAIAQNQDEASNPLHRLWARLTALRLVRNEAHVEAWQAAGLGAADVEVLTEAWAGTALQGEPTHSQNLIDLGFVSDGEVTQAGLEARSQIETATDDGVRAAYEAVDSREFLEHLGRLPPRG